MFGIKNNLNIKVLIFMFAVIPAVSLFAYFYFTVGAQFFNPFLQGTDQTEYGRIAVNLAENGVFSLSQSAPYLPDPSRTPIFPSVLALTYLLSGSFILFTFLNIFIGALTAVIVFEIALVITEKRWLAVASGIIFAFLPYRIYLSNLVMADTLFAFLFSILLLLFIKILRGDIQFNYANMGFLGALLGVIALTRPIAQFFIFVLAFFLIFLNNKEIKKKILMILFLFAVFGAVLSPWLIRNYIHFDQVFLSSIGRYHLYASYFTPWKAAVSGISRDQADFEMRRYIAEKYGSDAMYDLESATALGKEAKREILKHPFNYAFYHIIVTPVYFLNNDFLLTLREAFRMKLPNIYIAQKILQRDFSGIIKTVLNNDLFFVLFFFATYLFVALKSIFGIAGVLRYIKEMPLVSFFILASILYFPVIIGFEGHARFRIPVESFLIIFSLYFIANIYYVRNQRV